MDATNQKSHMDFSDKCPNGFWKVYKVLVSIFGIQTEVTILLQIPKVLPWLQEKRLKANRSSRDSVHKEFSKEFVQDLETIKSPRLVSEISQIEQIRGL